MTLIERLAALTMLVTGGVWAGVIVLYAVERVNLWARMPIEQFVVDFRRSLYRADPLQPILAVVSLAGSVLFAVVSDGLAAVFAGVGAAMIFTVIVISVALPERINAQFRGRPEGEAPPDAEGLRRRWRTLHLIRTAPTLVALVALVLATTFA